MIEVLFIELLKTSKAMTPVFVYYLNYVLICNVGAFV
jgi:hypothetical protein